MVSGAMKGRLRHNPRHNWVCVSSFGERAFIDRLRAHRRRIDALNARKLWASVSCLGIDPARAAESNVAPSNVVSAFVDAIVKAAGRVEGAAGLCAILAEDNCSPKLKMGGNSYYEHLLRECEKMVCAARDLAGSIARLAAGPPTNQYFQVAIPASFDGLPRLLRDLADYLETVSRDGRKRSPSTFFKRERDEAIRELIDLMERWTGSPNYDVIHDLIEVLAGSPEPPIISLRTIHRKQPLKA